MAMTDLEFYVIAPKEATNLVTNPSIEVATTGYTASGAGVSIARVTTEQRRGVASIEVTTANNVISGVYYSITLTAGVQYSFGADVLDVTGQTFNLFITDNAAALVSSNVTWTGNGRWKRRTVTYTAAGTATYRLYVTRSAVASTTKFYVDGFQLEVGAASSYLDGDMKGFVRTQTDYYWTGTPHASTSFRSGQTRSGGTEVRLKDYMRIIAVMGLGLAPIINSALPNVAGGEFYQSSNFDARTISLKGVFSGIDEGTILDNRKAVIAAINPKRTGADQPMILRIRGLSAIGGVEEMDTVDAVVQYSGGLDGNFDKPGAESAPLQFRMFLPYLVSDGDTGAALAISATVADADYAIRENSDGTFANISTDFNGYVSGIVKGNDGTVYFIGNFTNVGDANGDYIVQYNPSTGAVSSMGTGLNQEPYDIVVGPDGALYVCGNFTLAGGVAGTAYVAKWDGSVWSPLAAGLTSAAFSLAFDYSGNLYAGMGAGVAIQKWNGTAWAALGGVVNGIVHSMIYSGGALYFGGAFTTINGGTAAVGIAKYDGSAWASIGGGVSGGAATVFAMTFGKDENLYITGSFTSAEGVSAIRSAKWNGSSWSPLGSGLSDDGLAVKSSGDGVLYFGGIFITAGGLSTPDGVAIWNGSSWVIPNIDLPIASGVNSILIDSNVKYFGYGAAGSAVVSANTAITTVGSAPAAPKLIFTGPGTLYHVKNYTTGKTIYFNLTLLTGETAVLDLDPANPTFTSSFRGNIMSTILPGSNLDLFLMPGVNNISVFIAGTTSAATTATITYRERYESIDGAR